MDRKRHWEREEEQGHGKLGRGWTKRTEEKQAAREDRNTDQQKAANGEGRENRAVQRAVIEAGDEQKAAAKAGRGRTENNKEGEEDSKRERTKASRRQRGKRRSRQTNREKQEARPSTATHIRVI